MARYVVHVKSPKPPEEAFAFMADLRNFEVWDPGVVQVEQTEGDGGGSDSVFDVTVKGVPRPITLRYRTDRYEPSREIVASAESSILRSVDAISVRPRPNGCEVTYDAQLTMNGLLGAADPLLRLVFTRIGDRAAAGLIGALDGEKIEGPGT